MAIEGEKIYDAKGQTGLPSNQTRVAVNYDYQSIRNLALVENGVYEFMENAYFGHGGFRNGRYLVPHGTEELNNYQRRQDLAGYKNFIQSIIRAMIDPVFNMEINRTVRVGGTAIEDGMLINEFLKDADGCANGIKDLIDDALTYAHMMGVSFIVMDNFPVEEQPSTKEQAITDRKFPFAHVRKISEVTEWQCDRIGQLEWIVFQDEDTKDGKGEVTKHFSAWFKDHYEERSQKAEGQVIIDKSVPLALTRLPVVMVFAAKRKKIKDIKVDPPMFDIARINHGIFNMDSLITTQARTQGFSIYYVHEDNPGNLDASRHNYWSVPKDCPSPGIITPPAETLKALIEMANSLREDIYRLASQAGVDASKNVRNISGVALEWQFQPQETTYRRTAMIAKKAEQEVIAVFKDYTHEEFDYECAYPEKYGPDSTVDDIKNLDSVLMMTIPERPAMFLKKAAFLAVTTRMDGDEVAEILGDFDVIQKESATPPAADMGMEGGPIADGSWPPESVNQKALNVKKQMENSKE